MKVSFPTGSMCRSCYHSSGGRLDFRKKLAKHYHAKRTMFTEQITLSSSLVFLLKTGTSVLCLVENEVFSGGDTCFAPLIFLASQRSHHRTLLWWIHIRANFKRIIIFQSHTLCLTSRLSCKSQMRNKYLNKVFSFKGLEY